MIELLDEPRSLPYSMEAEQGVLGAVLFDNQGYDRAAEFIASKAVFFDSRHRAIWEAISWLVVAGKPADLFTVFARLSDSGLGDEIGGLAYLNALQSSVPSASNVRRYAEIVREKAMDRAIIAAADEAGTVAREKCPAGERIDRITTLFGELQRKQVKKVPRSVSEIAIERIDHYTDLADGKAIAGWRTHIPALTAKLNGGIRAGGLYILAARPSVGKSSFAEDLGLHFAQDGLPTLFLSQEMAESEVADRAVSNIGRLSYGALLTGKMRDDDWTRATEAMEGLAKLPFFVDDQASLTLQDIRLKAKHCKGLRVLVLDYLQLCASTRKDGNRNSEIEEISRGLKTLAKELGIAVVALSQLNRDVEKRANKRPSLGDLRDSGAIEQDADVVMFLWPVREFEQEGRKVIGCGIDKNRQGRCGDFGLDFYGDVQRWQESTADIRPAEKATGRGFE